MTNWIDKEVTKYNLVEWGKITISNFEINMFEGDHFFIVKNKKKFDFYIIQGKNKKIYSLKE